MLHSTPNLFQSQVDLTEWQDGLEAWGAIPENKLERSSGTSKNKHETRDVPSWDTQVDSVADMLPDDKNTKYLQYSFDKLTASTLAAAKPLCHWYTAGTHLQRRPHSQTSEGLGKGGAPITRNTRGIKKFKNKEHRASARQKAADPPIPSRLAKILQILSEGTPSPHPRKITAAMRREDTGHRDRKRGRNRCRQIFYSIIRCCDVCGRLTYCCLQVFLFSLTRFDLIPIAPRIKGYP